MGFGRSDALHEKRMYFFRQQGKEKHVRGKFFDLMCIHKSRTLLTKTINSRNTQKVFQVETTQHHPTSGENSSTREWHQAVTDKMM